MSSFKGLHNSEEVEDEEEDEDEFDELEEEEEEDEDESREEIDERLEEMMDMTSEDRLSGVKQRQTRYLVMINIQLSKLLTLIIYLVGFNNSLIVISKSFIPTMDQQRIYYQADW